MTDSYPPPEGFLTESVNAPGTLIEGMRQKCKQAFWKIDVCEMCLHADERLRRIGAKMARKAAYPDLWHKDPLNEYYLEMDLLRDETYKTHIAERLAYYASNEKAHPRKGRYASELGPREFTLTYSPAWFLDDMAARDNMRMAMMKLIRYYKDDITELRAVGEVGRNGQSHIHCYYMLTGGLKMTDKNFKRAWRHWNPKLPLGNGFVGGHHQTVKNTADFKGYIEKDIDEAWFDISLPE